MPFLDFETDDDEGIEEKFDGCEGCAFFGRERTCKGCDSGEFFEEREPEGLDVLFRN